jgi:hypothetical protein
LLLTLAAGRPSPLTSLLLLEAEVVAVHPQIFSAAVVVERVVIELPQEHRGAGVLLKLH